MAARLARCDTFSDKEVCAVHQRTRWTARQRNSARPMSRARMARPAVSASYGSQVSLLGALLRRVGVARSCVALVEGLTCSGFAVLRVVRSSVSTTAAMRSRCAVAVVMT
ncbi:hypothetical protein Kpho02_78140 [Kitasatospora phosalacinea]|uniref:Uncharacterized protein n=1 Tax=Kitasatospora phosalacinea TaxID=2065 RepID=A0A9W6QEW3_9ACTN|nr:hypothetical protein Kpho02_78140 [Kitasatospora phosalacinea]